MNRKSFVKRSFWASFMILLLLSLILRFLPFSLALADGDELKRDEIIEIAECYTTHSWEATNDNILHEQKFYGGYWWQIDTPDAETPRGISRGGWWITDTHNISIPYQWGGWSALTNTLECPDLNLQEDYDGNYFGEQLEEGYAAGDNYTEGKWVAGRKIPKPEYGEGCGVDCSGLVSRAWRTLTKFSTRSLPDISRPIQFKDLRPGDVLNKPRSHVMLFKEFVTTDEKETPGTTKIRVYEASACDWRVSEREYLLKAFEKKNKEEEWKGTKYKTDVVTLERVADGELLYGYVPRTYLNPIDIVLVIDRSGSMGSESKMESARDAAKMFVDLMRTGDKVGVVDFDDKVSVTYELTEIDPEGTVKTDAKNAIDTLYARDYTSIGGGLQKGQEELNTRGEGDPVRVMVLLSDGKENRAPYVADVLPDIIKDKIAVHTVGLGSDADQELLQSIADQTGGEYRFSPLGKQLGEIYNSISAAVYGETVCRTASGTVALGQTVEEAVLVDSTIGKITFSLFWSGSDLDLTLVQPDGNVIDPSVAETDPNISFASGATYEFYKVATPQYGGWAMRIFGESTPPGGEEYTISASAMDAMIFSVETDKPKYCAGSPIRITASIEDSFLDVTEPQYILGVTMTVTAEDPARNVYSFDLYDDGLHGDGEANDGIYANTFTNTSLLGSYNFSVKASGLNNRHGQAFTREFALSTVVATSPVKRVYLPLILKNYPPDTTPPAAVTNLATSNPTLDSITLNWTAPGDDDNIGIASEYDIRYSTSPISDANWNVAAQCVGEPAPQSAGSSETFTVHGLAPNTTYYFALKTADEVPNWSCLSNVASGTTLRPPDQLIINCGFETDEGWVFGETPRPAAYTTEDAHWGARSVRLGIKPPTTDAYSWSSVRQRITIPANARSATLSFWYKPFSEAPCWSNWQQFDWSDYSVDQLGRIRPSRNPLSWASCDWQQAYILADDFPNPTILATVMNINSSSGVWTHRTFDLMPFAGQTVWVYFNVYNDGWGYGRTWMYVDDASVMVYY